MIVIMMVITKHQLYQLMWVNQCHVYHPPVITMFIGGINYYYSQMGGWWHCFTHISWDSWCLVMTIIIIIIITIINHHQLLYYHWFCPHYYNFPGWNLGLPHGQSPIFCSPLAREPWSLDGRLPTSWRGAAGRERTRGWAMLFGQPISMAKNAMNHQTWFYGQLKAFLGDTRFFGLNLQEVLSRNTGFPLRCLITSRWFYSHPESTRPKFWRLWTSVAQRSNPKMLENTW